MTLSLGLKTRRKLTFLLRNNRERERVQERVQEREFEREREEGDCLVSELSI